MRDKLLYDKSYVEQYIKEYTETGFDMDNHSDFANVEQKQIELEEVIITAERKSKEEKEHSPKAVIDNLWVRTSSERIITGRRRMDMRIVITK